MLLYSFYHNGPVASDISITSGVTGVKDVIILTFVFYGLKCDSTSMRQPRMMKDASYYNFPLKDSDPNDILRGPSPRFVLLGVLWLS